MYLGKRLLTLAAFSAASLFMESVWCHPAASDTPATTLNAVTDGPMWTFTEAFFAQVS
jgi:hypothetical protein